ncbi:DUF3576 domain-containing protein [Paremcibacter congregatus]|uniref:DUF3576 domain-containing protein n=1 Tax=Paremcibacter congregatus TaxID=2043170 RepID=UPI0030EF49E8|tara:strand:+ start:596 stop:1078 length:483 start_codon:yes stop_codon:yes gene_type:complete
MTVNDIITNGIKKSAKAVVLGGMAGVMMTLGGCSIFGGNDKAANIEAAEEVYQIGVNAYLWRASLETLDFMPLLTADHNGGVILSDWKVNPQNPEERTKVDVRIVGKKLTADSVKVTVHRQAKSPTGWTDMAPRPGASINIRNAILMQAKLLRRNNAPTK